MEKTETSLDRYLTVRPQLRYLPEFDPKEGTDWYGIRAFLMEGAPYRGQRAKVFGYIGYPDAEPGQRVPGIVLLPVGEISFDIEVPEDFSEVFATVRYLTEPMAYDENDHMTSEWRSALASVCGGRVTATVPDGACAYFVETSGVADGVRYVSDSALIQRG